jgi:tetratricopeptide (TPR) repeat protein
MIAAFLIAAASAAPAPVASIAPETVLEDAAQATAAGRLDQARLMVGRAIGEGLHGSKVDRVLADLAFGEGNYSEAVSRYEGLLSTGAADPVVLERAGIAALRLGALTRAAPLIARATKADGASWRAWNARAVLADLNRDWADADTAYAEASRLAPNEAGLLNNRGWSQLLRGNWPGAIQDFEQAAALDPTSTRIANNLELARAALASDLPRRRDGESDEGWAMRLNDAGVAAEILGDKARAIAAFTQALTASGRWYARAANNLEAARGQ